MTQFIPNRFRKAVAALVAAALCSPAIGAPQAPATPPPTIVTTAPPAPASAKPAVPRIYVSADGETIYLVGMILDGSFERFDEVLAGAPKARTLFLSSPGGLTLQGRLIAALVRKRKLNTYVEQYCASACTQVFVAGRERIIGKEARLGFHQAVAVDRQGRPGRASRTTDRELTPTTVFGVSGNDTLRLAYEQAGLTRDFIDRALAQDHDGMWFPTVKELTEGKVITRLTERLEVALPEGSFSRAELDAILVKRPLWQRAKEQFPTGYAEALDEAWRLGNSGTALEMAISSGRGQIVVAAMSRVARASDQLLDRHLKLYADTARAEREEGYPLCGISLDDQEKDPDPANLAFERTEDEILIAILDQPPAVAAMSKTEAFKIFSKDIAPALGGFSASSNSCKLGFQMLEAIDGMSGKKRIRSYRALLVLPDALGL